MKKVGLSIVGSARCNGDREKNDFYPTPEYVTEALVENVIFTGNIWECACGDGAISRVLKKTHDVYSTDLIDRGYGDDIIDFLNADKDLVFDNIITNPPFRFAEEFVWEAKKHARKKIALFLKTVFLEGAKRYTMFQDRKFPLSGIYQFSKRVPIYKNGEKMKNSGMIAYAWFVWDKEHTGKPTISWIL